MYFGGDGYVGKFYAANADDGQNITASIQQAYSYFDARGQNKRFTMVRPIFLTTNAAPTVLCGINVDFQSQNNLGAVTFNPSSVGVWDTGLWDEATWGDENYTVNKFWQGVTGIGYAGGVVMNVAAQDTEVRWSSTDFVFEDGGVL